VVLIAGGRFAAGYALGSLAMLAAAGIAWLIESGVMGTGAAVSP
jgi:hypothetical protein